MHIICVLLMPLMFLFIRGLKVFFHLFICQFVGLSLFVQLLVLVLRKRFLFRCIFFALFEAFAIVQHTFYCTYPTFALGQGVFNAHVLMYSNTYAHSWLFQCFFRDKRYFFFEAFLYLLIIFRCAVGTLNVVFLRLIWLFQVHVEFLSVYIKI